MKLSKRKNHESYSVFLTFHVRRWQLCSGPWETRCAVRNRLQRLPKRTGESWGETTCMPGPRTGNWEILAPVTHVRTHWWVPSLCYALSSLTCYALLCHAMLCFVILCYAVLRHTLLWYAILCYAILCYALSCYAMLCFAMLCLVMQAMVWYAVLCFAMLRHDALCLPLHL